MDDAKPFRILSLDGGGIMGAFTASVLATYERDCRARTGRGLVEHFDLITGTSTGGIIAIGLAMGATPDQILDFYRMRAARIFSRSKGVTGWMRDRVGLNWIRGLMRPKYTPSQLRAAVAEVVGERPLSEACTRLVIPAYQLSPGRVYLFKTPHAGDTRDVGTPAVDVALATSAAPTFFPAHYLPGRGKFVDGGLWANCPAMTGITEAVAFCRRSLDDIRVLSIGTTSYPFRLGDGQARGGLLGWGPRIIETFMFGMVQSAIAQATCLLSERFVRVDFLTERNVYTMDDARATETLIEDGLNEAEKRDHLKSVRALFLDGQPADPYCNCLGGGPAKGSIGADVTAPGPSTNPDS